jgi:FkbM family methyltransferase
LVFDVGANRGEYAKAVLRLAPDAIVHCFEIVPAVAALLKDALADRPAAHVHDFGLSNAAGEAAVSWNRAWDTASAIVARAGDPLFADSEVTTVMGRVDTGDAVAARLAVAAIDLLKIDVEGHELEVLLGFRETLRSAGRRPRVIQFEYGATWLPARHNLQEAYALLEPLGYRIGRLYPDGVEFKPYAFADDHFRMGNYVAAQGGDPLLERLARF